MAQSFNSLPGIIAKIQRRINGGVKRVTKDAAASVLRTAVRATRVDTGKARSNWIATLDQPNSGTIPAHAPGNKLGRGERANATVAVNAGLAVIRQFSNVEAGSIFVTNNVDYIETLNDGRSGSAPDQMKEQAVQAGVLTIKRNIKKALRGK